MPIILVLIAIPSLLVAFVMLSSVATEVTFGTVLAGIAVVSLLGFVIGEMIHEAQDEGA